MVEKEILKSVQEALREEPLSISELSKKVKINWRTSKHYLEMFLSLGLVFEKKVKNTRTFFLRDEKNYFDLPIKSKHRNKINAIYNAIKKNCLSFYGREPTKTQAYKILWKIDKEFDLGLPIGWYLYGPCCIQTYSGKEKATKKLSQKEQKMIELTTQEFCKLDNFLLQNKIYNQANAKLYQTKEKLLAEKHSNKEKINTLLIDLIKFTPPETVDVVTDFARTVLTFGYEKNKICFDLVWKYVSRVNFKDSLRSYYGEFTDAYFNDKIQESKKEAQLQILSIVQSTSK